MKRTLLFIALLGLFSLKIQAQQTNRPHCYTDEVMKDLIQNDPQYQLNIKALNDYTENFIKTHPQNKTNSQVYIIPVVFHVLHDYGPENVSDNELRHAVELMNIDYRKLNADTVNIWPQFKPIAADCEIEFRLATIDPVGNCTNGIEHIWTLKTYQADDASKTDPSWMVWPNSKYLNIWIAHTLQNPDAAAYAHIPGGQASTDGIMCWYTYADNNSRTLTHEAGHHFNLYHPWGGSNTPGQSCDPINDHVDDTPMTQGFSPGQCPNDSLQIQGWQHARTCGGPVENWQNIMDYSYCDNMFTEGQKERMHKCLDTTVSNRNNLWKASNLLATGTDQPNMVSQCIPKADFKSEYHATCVNTPMRFFDLTWKGTPTTWTWYFPGGNPTMSNDTNPLVTYATPGVYDATLVVANATGSDSVTKSSFVHVSGPALTSIPYIENFEDPASFPGVDGWIDNNDGSSINWARVNFASADSGAYSLKINNYTNVVRNVEEWVTPSLNFTNFIFPIKVQFKVAYAQKSAAAIDQLQVWYSTDCGTNWTPTPYSKSGASLATNGGAFVSNSFTPNSTQWRQESVTVNAVQNTPNVRFKFVNTTGRGNNIYVDNINIFGNPVGVEETDLLESGVSVYPNPTNGSSTVNFNLLKSSDLTLEVKDIIGQSVAKVFASKRFDTGPHQIELPVLSPGIYMVNLTVNKTQNVVKLVVN